MIEVLFFSFVVRFVESAINASPFIIAGLIVAAVFRRMLGRTATLRLFGSNSSRGILQAWALGMLLPVCSLGVLPAIRELRRMGTKGGTILAFAMSAPLFNPLSLLYGLTLSEPVAIVAFAACSLVIVTVVGLLWDRMFADSIQSEPEPAAVPYGIRRLAAVALAALREAGGASAGYVLVGLVGVGLMGALLGPSDLQHSVNGDDWLAPVKMAFVAVPLYATPMLAMSQLGMMFQHANSPGAAFVLLTLGAGMNTGLLAWMLRQYGGRRSLVWFALLFAIVLGLAYGVDKPLFPTAVQPADHTHAFDVYCRPFHDGAVGLPQASIERIARDTAVFERYTALGLLIVAGLGGVVNLADRRQRLERWLERPAPSAARSFDVVVPGPVLGGIALLGLVVVSIVGCYAYYPPASEVAEEMVIAKAEAMSGALSGDVEHAKYWIEIYDDWSRKLEVGCFLRDGHLSDYHRAKAALLREKLELLKHEVEDREMDLVKSMVGRISAYDLTLKKAFLEER